MEILNSLAHGFAVALTPTNMTFAVFGCFLGTIIGALPGIGPVNGVAILIPLAFFDHFKHFTVHVQNLFGRQKH